MSREDTELSADEHWELLVAETKVLYKALGVIDPKSVRREPLFDCQPVPKKHFLEVSSLARKLVDVPKCALNEMTATLFRVLNDPAIESLIPEISRIDWSNNLPIVLFKPGSLRSETVMFAATAHISFATCMGARHLLRHRGLF